jgi:peptidoglycan/LPS O-acetylase OafA/YrhL
VRRVVSITMVFFGIAMLITGIWNIFPPLDAEFFPPHAISSFVFGVLAVLHIWLNWKPTIRYFRGLGWWWVLVGLGVLMVVWMGILAPVLNMNSN